MLSQFDTERAEIFAARVFQESLMRDTSPSEISQKRTDLRDDDGPSYYNPRRVKG